MTFSATIPVEHMDAANAELNEPQEDSGRRSHGPNNFKVPLREGTDLATHAGMHSWDDDDFLAAVQALDYPGLVIRHDPGFVVNFSQHVQDQALEWSDSAHWTVDPIMTGDQRQHDGKTWESLIEYNVWMPPVGWREVVQDGYPEWVQPTGSHNAYQTGEMVTHNNPNDNGAIWVYRSKIDANTTEPGRDGTYDRWWEPVERA